jgi:APA family basic amino acid/polyamine antiporter
MFFCFCLTGLENYLNFKGDASPVTTAFAKTGYTFLNSALTIAILQDTLQ